MNLIGKFWELLPYVEVVETVDMRSVEINNNMIMNLININTVTYQ